CHSLKLRMSWWLETTATTSIGSVPVLHRCSMLFKQWPCLETAITTLHLRDASWKRHCILNCAATDFPNASCNCGRDGAPLPLSWNTVRMNDMSEYGSS